MNDHVVFDFAVFQTLGQIPHSAGKSVKAERQHPALVVGDHRADLGRRILRPLSHMLGQAEQP